MGHNNCDDKLRNILIELLKDMVPYVYSEKDIQYILTDYENDYYIVVAIPLEEIIKYGLAKDIKMIKAMSKLCIIFDANDCPKKRERLFYMLGNNYDYLDYNQWKKVFELGIDNYVKKGL